jgi:hypothetical protein
VGPVDFSDPEVQDTRNTISQKVTEIMFKKKQMQRSQSPLTLPSGEGHPAKLGWELSDMSLSVQVHK